MTTEKDREWTPRIIDALTANGVNCGDFNLFILDEEVAELRSETVKDVTARVCKRTCPSIAKNLNPSYSCDKKCEIYQSIFRGESN